jgi:hypothetical protein
MLYDQTVINLVEGVSIWGVPGLEVDSFVHEVRTLDRNLPACGKVDQSEAIFICTVYSHAGCVCLSLADVWFPGQLLRSRLLSPTSRHVFPELINRNKKASWSVQ